MQNGIYLGNIDLIKAKVGRILLNRNVSTPSESFLYVSASHRTSSIFTPSPAIA